MGFHKRESQPDFVLDELDQFGVLALDHLEQLPLIVVCVLATSLELAPVIRFVRRQCSLGVLSLGSGVLNFLLFAPVCERR